MNLTEASMLLLQSLTTIPTSTICVSAIIVILTKAYFWHIRSKSQHATNEIASTTGIGVKQPEKWVKVGTVKKLIVYPIKSCSGQVLDKAVLTPLGLKYEHANIVDRSFMIVDENGQLVTLMDFPKMALVKPTISEDNCNRITVNAPDMPSFTFTFPVPDGHNERVCRVEHDSNLKALDCGDEVAQWFCEYLQNSSLRVYYHHLQKTQRSSKPYMNKCPQFEQSDMGAFQSKTSYLLNSEETITEINKFLEKKTSWKNWRPTILVDQVSEPFAELNWSFVRIGNGVLKSSFPCKRCTITAVDHEVGELKRDGEPLKTLKSMKIDEKLSEEKFKEVCKNKAILGLCLGLSLPAGEGAVICTGDTVYAASL